MVNSYHTCLLVITLASYTRLQLAAPSTTLKMDLFHNDVKRGKRDVRRNLIGLKTTFVIAERIKFRVSSCKPRLTSLRKRSIPDILFV